MSKWSWRNVHGKYIEIINQIKPHFYTLPHKKWLGIMLYPSNCLNVRPGVHPSVSASFLDSDLSIYWPIFVSLCMDIDIREEWFGITNRLNLFINNRVMALDLCKKNVFFLNIFRTNGWILIKLFICIDIYKIHVVSNILFTRWRSCTAFICTAARLSALNPTACPHGHY